MKKQSVYLVIVLLAAVLLYVILGIFSKLTAYVLVAVFLLGETAPGLISCVLLMVFLLLALTVAGYFIHGTLYVTQKRSLDKLLNRDQQVKQRAAFLELMVISVAMAGVYAFEQQNHMRQINRTSYRGRWLNRVTKPVVAMGFCALTAVAMHAVQMVHIGITMEFNDLNVPVQSLTFMREFPLYLSIGGYLACMFGLRVLVAMVLGGVILVLSRICADKFTALGLGTFICMLLLSLSGLIQELHFLNPIYLLSADFFR